MSIKNKVALALTLVLASSSIALAQGGVWTRGTGMDSNAGNVIPLMNQPGVYGYNAIGSLGMLLPSAPTESSQVGLAAGGTLRSSQVSLSGRAALRSKVVSLDDQQVSSIQAAVAAAYPTDFQTRGTLRGAIFSGRTGLYREDAVRLGMAKLYGGSNSSYQTASVGLYQPGFQSARVGLYGRPYAAGRIAARAAYRSQAVGLRRGYGSVEPLPSASGY
jgi:hypothetical protein